MKLMCWLFGHKLGPEMLVCWDRQFGRLTLQECCRCGHRVVEDDEDRRKRELVLPSESR